MTNTNKSFVDALTDGVVTDAVLLDNEIAALQVLSWSADVPVRIIRLGRGRLVRDTLNTRRCLTSYDDAGAGVYRLHGAVAAVEVGAESADVVRHIRPVELVVLTKEEVSAVLAYLQ